MCKWICPAVLLAVVVTESYAEVFPSRAVRIVVPYPAGGTTDVVTRPVAQKLADALGQQFIVDNRGGANGIIGSDLVAKASPDGYTLLIGSSATSSNGTLYTKLPYDTLKDFSPVTLVASTPYFLIVNASVPANSVKELIALAKTKPQKINFASSGVGGTPHLAGEMFNSMAGVQLTHVPYKGTGPAITDLLGGQVQLMFVGLPATSQHIQAGKLKALAVADAQRSVFMPDLPTISEAGLPGFEANSWFGMLAPRGTPRDIEDKLATEVARILATRDIKERFAGFGAIPISNTPQEFAAFFREDFFKWAKVVKASGAKAE